MAAIYHCFKDIDGKTAYLSGVVSALSDETLGKIIPPYWAVEADVFETDDENLVSSIKDRLHKFEGVGKHETPEWIENLYFEMEECKSGFEQALHLLFTSHSSKEKECINEFLKSIHFQLGDIKALYRIKKPLEKTTDKWLSEYYTYVVFDVLFIQYTDYMVMVVLGSDE